MLHHLNSKVMDKTSLMSNTDICAHRSHLLCYSWHISVVFRDPIPLLWSSTSFPNIYQTQHLSSISNDHILNHTESYTHGPTESLFHVICTCYRLTPFRPLISPLPFTIHPFSPEFPQQKILQEPAAASTSAVRFSVIDAAIFRYRWNSSVLRCCSRSATHARR